ncbi:MAG TPA: cobalamin-independent methionine synthase II family protein [Steroidobacteraceae bacterium]|nr:cobalamin-independent methionine synthase II family protein [Steroidobacteraceae bacterium]
MSAILHAETVGSLQRPAFLLAARSALARGEISAASFKKIEDRAVDESLGLQEAVGLQVVTDGEQRCESFHEWLIAAVDGVTRTPALPIPLRGLPGYQDETRCSPVSVTGKLRLEQSSFVEEFVYARAKTTRRIKVTVPSPMIYFLHIGRETRNVYPNPFDLFTDAAHLLREECRRLAQAGCDYIQIDAPELTHPSDPLLRRTTFPERGISPDEFAERASDLLNIVTDVPGVEFAVHFCRGNSPTHYFSAGGYEAAIRNVCHGVKNASTFLMEFDDSRAGPLEFLRNVPDEKRIMLGLVSSMKRAELEPVEDVISRIEEASRFHPRENLGIAPQCGFCSQVGIQGFDQIRQRQKLELVVEIARRAWG